MDLNHLLIWFVCISCIANLIRGLQHYRSAGGWVIISASILLFTLALWLRHPQTAGYISGVAWALLIVLPLISFRRTQMLAAQYRFQAATRWAYLGRLFHPFDGWGLYPPYLRALALAQAGHADAKDHFQRLKNTTSGLGQAAYCNLFRVEGDWQGLRHWIEKDITLKKLSRYPRLISFYLQALGETQALTEMIAALEHLQALLQKAGPTDWNLCRLIVFAYCGEPAMVSHLLQGTTKTTRDRRFWLATAYMAAGKTGVAQADIDQILESGDLLYFQTLRTRKNIAGLAKNLSHHSHSLLQQWRPELGTSPRPVTAPSMLNQSPISLLFIALNLVAFGLELQQGGSTNPETLYNLGALVPEVVIAGAWWRLLTSTFLHFGWMHLLFNMLGLAILGPFVERQLGWLRYGLMYLAAGVGSMLTLTILATQGFSETKFALGASGAVMGIIGAEAAILILLWRRKPSRLVTQRLRRVGLIVALQTFFDLTTPQISFIGHMSGLILGFIVGMMLQFSREP